MRAFAQSVTVTGPDALAAGSTATLGGELVQPNGVATGTRRVPLRYPMSVRWSAASRCSSAAPSTTPAAPARSRC